MGYRWYDARRMPVRWPFGHGLSYTGFVYKAAALSADTMDENGSVTVTVTVRNTGARPGKEVVQLYIADETGTTGRPPKELRHFAKVALEPGEEKQVSFTLTARDLSYYDEKMGGWYAASGDYTVLIGHSSRNIPARLTLHYQTARRRPLTVDENTAMGDLLRDARTAPVMKSVLQSFGSALGMNGGGENAAITEEAGLQMLDAMPLRAMASFGGAQAAAAHARPAGCAARRPARSPKQGVSREQRTDPGVRIPAAVGRGVRLQARGHLPRRGFGFPQIGHPLHLRCPPRPSTASWTLNCSRPSCGAF